MKQTNPAQVIFSGSAKMLQLLPDYDACYRSDDLLYHGGVPEVYESVWETVKRD